MAFSIKYKKCMTITDAAEELGVPSARVAQMCEEGQLTFWRDGSRRLAHALHCPMQELLEFTG